MNKRDMMNFTAHIRKTCEKTNCPVLCLPKVLPNTRGSGDHRGILLHEVMALVVLYAAAVGPEAAQIGT